MQTNAQTARQKAVWKRYAIALLCIAAALLIRWPLFPVLGGSRPYLTLFGAVAVAVWFCRWRPAAIAAAVGFFVANYFLASPPGVILFNEFFMFELIGYTLSAGCIIFFGEAMHRARETELRQKSLTATTLASIGDGVVVTDGDGKVTFLNAEAERLTRYSNEEAAGRPLTEVFRIINEESRKEVENPVDKVLRLGTVVGLANHTLLVGKDGSETPIDDSAAPIKGSGDDSISGVVLVFRDVTEQRRAQQADARLAAIVEFSGDAIFTKNTDGVIQTWNASAERLFGYSAKEIIGKPISVLIPRDRLVEEDEIIARLREGRPSERFETIRIAKDGRRIPVAVSVSPLKDAEGEVVGASKIIHDITELVAAREALVREKELLATTLASIGDAVIVTDAKGRITFLNAEAERLTEWKSSEAAGRPLPEIFRIINEETRASVEDPVEKVMRHGGVVGLANHTILVGKNGLETPIDDSAAPIREPGGPLFGIVLVFRDFSERKQAEEALREREERFRTMADSAPVLIWMSGTDKLCYWFNQRWLEFTGRSMEQELGNGWAEGVHPDDFDRCLQTYVNAFDARQSFSMEYRLKRHDGAWRWVIDNGLPLYGPDQKFTGYIGSCLDITEKKDAAEALQRAADEQRILSQALAHLLSTDDPERVVRELFPTLAEHVGVDAYLNYMVNEKGDALSLHSYGGIPEERAREIKRLEFGQAICGTVAKTGRPIAAFDIQHSDYDKAALVRSFGIQAYVCNPLLSGEGLIGTLSFASHKRTHFEQSELEFLKLISSYVSVAMERARTEHALRQAKGELQEHATKLESTVAERTGKLREMVSELQQVSYSITHDMRSPVRAMGTFAQLLLDGSRETDGSPENKDYCRRIVTAAGRLDRLINDALNYTKAVLQELPMEEVDLSRFLSDLIETYPNLHPSKADIKIEGALPVVLGNESLLTQCFSNLLGNAVKFVAPGTRPSVRIRVDHDDGLGRIWVEDNGIGIPAHAKERLFRMFQKLDNQYDGTGIGLAIVRKVAERMGGRVGAESEEAKGSRFWVELPLASRGAKR
jgi:PAS domain S-box-containing protein